MIVAFLTYVRRFYRADPHDRQPVDQLQSALAGAERIFELLDTEPEIVDAPDADDAASHPGAHRLRPRRPLATSRSEPVLQDVILDRRAGADDGPGGADRRGQDDASSTC